MENIQKESLILIAEDNIRYNKLLCHMLNKEGYKTIAAFDGKNAIDKLKKITPDLVLLDVMMPEVNGFEVCLKLKENLDTRSIPVIFLSARNEEEIILKGFETGGVDYLIKPVNKTELLARVKTHIYLKKATDRLIEKQNKLQKINERLAREIYERARVQKELLKKRQHLEAIFGSVRDGIVTVDKNMNVIDMNGPARNICSFPDRFEGKSFWSITSNCNRACYNAIVESIDKEIPVNIYNINCQDNQEAEKQISLTISPLVNEEKKSYGAVMVFRDETRLAYLEKQLKEREQFHNITGKSEVMQKVYSLIETMADVRSTVLIIGESGTGKELVADAIHYTGERKSGPFIKVNCSALSENLLESELFGHVKGAFTGAVKDTKGRFYRAHKGTIFLDEIGDISPALQVKLLRVLQEGEFERVGDSRPVKVDVRIITATNKDLKEKVSKGEFREDLYYRLKVVEIAIPPLRHRTSDIPILAAHFLKKFNKKFNKNIKNISEEVMSIFMRYPWPGNVRQLEHTLEYASILSSGPFITKKDLPADLIEEIAPIPLHTHTEFDRKTILKTLERTGGNKARAARELGISRQTIYRKIKEYNIK